MNKKKIKILTRGAIRVKGFINGPVLTPYYEDVNTIFAMIVAGVHIVEVLEDGSEVRLTTTNFAEINTPEQPVKTKTENEPKAPIIKEEENVEEVIEEVRQEPETVIISEVINMTEESTDEEVKEVEFKKEPDFNRMNKYNKKNHKKNN